MTLFEAVQLVIAADEAPDHPDYDLLDDAATECRIVLARRPHATGPLVDAARAFIAWNTADMLGDGYAWTTYDKALALCRAAVFAIENRNQSVLPLTAH